MPDSSAYLVLPDREICQDYLQSNKKVRSRNSLAWSWTLRPNGTSCAQKAASYRLRRYCQRSFTMELGRTHSLQGRVWEGEERTAVTGEDRPFFGEILLAVGTSTLKTTRQCPTSTHATIADWFDIDPNARTGIVHKNLYILWIIAVMKNAVKIKRRLLRASLIYIENCRTPSSAPSLWEF